MTLSSKSQLGGEGTGGMWCLGVRSGFGSISDMGLVQFLIFGVKDIEIVQFKV